jgi:hypothetical protein
MCHTRLSGNSIILCDLPEPHGARGDICVGTLTLQAGTVCSENRSKAWHSHVVDLCNNML